MNRYWIERQPQAAIRVGDQWDHVLDCAEGLVLPEMALMALDILQQDGAAFTRIRCQQQPANRGPDTVAVFSNKQIDQERRKWERKLERYRKSQAAESPA